MEYQGNMDVVTFLGLYFAAGTSLALCLRANMRYTSRAKKNKRMVQCIFLWPILFFWRLLFDA